MAGGGRMQLIWKFTLAAEAKKLCDGRQRVAELCPAVASSFGT